MKKFIIIGILLVTAVIIAQTGTRGRIHVIDRPLKVEGFINAQGNIYPVWSEKYDLGTADYWWDSIYCEDGQYRYIILWSADSTDTAFVSPTKLTIDSIVANYYGGMGAGAVDTFYFKQGTEWTASGWLVSGDTIKVDTTSGGGSGTFDSLYVLQGTTWETEAWLKGTDTIRLDTTS